ncbi:RNA polymerase sigma factor [candidate division KSB1 bacterium]|nr:RNA polymerase sigma factor [candidate division KSB1 bacterium]
MPEQEHILIAKAQRGNIQAFEQLIYRYDAQVMALIYNMVNNSEDARDIYQDVFVKVFTAIKKFRQDSKFETWVYRIAINTCINFRKSRSRFQFDEFNELDNNQINDNARSNESQPDQSVLNAELNSHIQEAISSLSPKQRAVFVLRHYHEYKLSEIADMLGYSDGTVKNYLFRATQKMKVQLQELYEDHES